MSKRQHLIQARLEVIKLIQEAHILATLINTDRFLGVVPSEDLTVRLVEVLDTLSEECVV